MEEYVQPLRSDVPVRISAETRKRFMTVMKLYTVWCAAQDSTGLTRAGRESLSQV